ncbi:MAG: M20/M25/M40 family metallo-hydrolase [Microgenomates group bacterium]
MNQLIDLFTTICQIDSPTGEEEKMVEFVFNFLKKLGVFVKKDSYGNIYARVGKNPKVFLSAHLDTVEPGRNIKPIVGKNYITSSGTTILGADNKVAVACILQTTKEIVEEKIDAAYEIIFTLSEEVGNYGAVNFNYKLLQSKVGFCFDSSNPLGTIITASPFYERFDLEVIGQEAHASKPDEAINVLPFLADLIKKQKLGKVDPYSLFNIGVFSGGYVRNTIPGQAKISGEIRSFYEKNLLKIKDNFLKKLEVLSKKYKIKLKKDFVRENPGYFHNSLKAKKEIEKIRSILRKNKLVPKEKIAWGVSDANIFNEKGVLCFNLADATEFTHSKKERIRIKDLLKLKEITKSIVISF